ncbi:MAG: flagellar hook-basal body complex protein FliE [Acidobacteria bacterium]|nr:flagellar hook-basal body complex protein FliE [Acidobacteriota bacterium]
MMLDPLAAPAAPAPAAPATPSAAAAAPPAPGVGGSFQALLAAVDDSTAAANDAVAGMIAGTSDVHTAMIALQRADMTFQLTVQIRNKLVQAYQDVMRMAI